MKAYRTDWLDALEIHQLAGSWKNKKWIDAEQHRQMETHFPAPFYTPHFFVRLGLFLFTAFLTFCAVGLASFLFYSSWNSASEESAGVLALLYGVGTTLALEYFIGTKHHYRSGIDDALLYLALALFITGLSLLLSSWFKDEPLGYCLLAFPVLLAGSIRYADRLVAVLTACCLLAIVALFCVRFEWGRIMLPFVMMGMSASVYYFLKRQLQITEKRYWAKCFQMVEGLVLLTFYLSGNYYVVREGNALINETSFREYTNPQIEAIETQRNDLQAENLRLQEKNESLRSDSLSLSQNEVLITVNEQRISENYDKMSALYDRITEIRVAERDKQEATGVKFAWLFYAFTFLVPLLLLVTALRRRDRTMLWIGMGTTVLAVLTYRYYHSLVPAEVALTLAGAFLLSLVYFSIRFLKTPLAAERYGLTYLDENEAEQEDALNAEAAILSNNLGDTDQPEPGVEFGGGDFGGGGAGNRY
jgi:uncharacterized membrane protein YgcG